MSEKVYKYCPRFSKALHNISIENKLTEVLRTRCKQWDCPYCAAINRRVWLRRITLEMEKDKPRKDWHFWTITLDGKDHKSGVGHSLKVWREHWNSFMTRLRTLYGKFRYIRIFEQHKSGVLHVHMLADFAPPDVKRVQDKTTSRGYVYTSKELRKILKTYKLGERHDITPIEWRNRELPYAGAVAGYVGKYMTKDMQETIRAVIRDNGYGRLRMIQASRGFADLPDISSGKDWRLGGVTFREFLKMVDDGIEVYDLQKNIYIDHADFENGLEYPQPEEL